MGEKSVLGGGGSILYCTVLYCKGGSKMFRKIPNLLFEGFPNGIVTIMNYDSLDQLVISRNIRFHFITISQVEFQHLRIIKVFYNQKLFNWTETFSFDISSKLYNLQINESFS